MLALASLLILSSCGQTAGVKTAGAQHTTGEIVASSETAIAQTESGKVGGFLQDGIYTVSYTHLTLPTNREV